jgi:Flp pilus assembly protein TadB
MIIAIGVLLFSGWKAWKLIRADPDAFKALPESEKEPSLKDLSPRLIVVLVAALIILVLVQFRVFSFNPFLDTILAAVALLLTVYYFFQKRKLRKRT